jgi:hypothetical protein
MLIHDPLNAYMGLKKNNGGHEKEMLSYLLQI